jgi:mono/diheme cytochrome c family protein
MRIKLLLGALAIAGAAQAAPSAAPEMMQGGNLFVVTCSSSFCHGEGGAGAQGPSLRNRNFTPDFVRNTVTNGRSGTPMPAFKDSLSQTELSMIVDFVMSLSPNNHNTNTAAVSAPAAATQAPVPLSAQALAGSALFFDASRIAGCALCHSYKEQGGPIGPDLTAIAKGTPHDIYQSIVKPAVPNPNYPAVTVTDRGKTVSGIPKLTTDKIVQLYDLSSAPPVLRSFYPADGAKTETPTASAPYAHDLSSYSKDELTALIAFLKSAAGASKDVTPQDFAQP